MKKRRKTLRKKECMKTERTFGMLSNIAVFWDFSFGSSVFKRME
jgi:hypothetical protein